MIALIVFLSFIPIAIAPIWYGSGDDTGLVLRMSCEGNFLDSSGSGNHGTQSGGVTITNGVKGRACGFDGVNDLINISYLVTNKTSNITISAWIKFPSNPSTQQGIISHGSTSGTNSFNLNLETNGSVRFWYSNVQQAYTPLVSPNVWHHIVAVENDTHSTVYLDGTSPVSIATTHANTTNSYPVYIGSWNNQATWWFNGSIDEVRIYNRTLSAEEISALYDTGKTYKLEWKTDPALGGLNETPAPTKSDETGLVGYWKMDGDATDSSGEGNDGTVNGAISTDAGRWNGAYEFETVNTSTLTLDYTTWKDGQTGSVGVFSANGDVTENYRVIDRDPWNRQTVVWKAIPDAVSGADGGWNSGTFAINNNKTYRFTTWINRKVQGASGTFYLGTHGYGSVNNISNLAGTATYNNPYFITGGATALPADTWILLVAFVHPYNYSGSNHEDSGWYYVNGTKYSSSMTDFKWLPQSTSSNHRSYLYYCTDTSAVQQWIYPRVDVIDGTEPSVAELTEGYGSYGDDIVAEVTKDKVSFSFWYDNKSNNKWVHVVNSSGTLYVNGELGTPNEYPLYVYGTNVTIGRTTASNYFNGKIDEVRLYNRTLSTDEVKELYLSKGLVGHWKMDADQRNTTHTFDSSKYDNHATLHGEIVPSLTNEGKFKEAYKFDGSNKYIKASVSENLNFTDSFTISGWVKQNNCQGYLVDKRVKNYDNGYAISFLSNCAVRFQIEETSLVNSPYADTDTGTITTNRWHHIVGVRDVVNDQLYVYIDGIRLKNVTDTTTVGISSNAPFEIGRGGAEGTTERLNGTIDEVRIYNRALSSTEVEQLYEGTKTNKVELLGDASLGILNETPAPTVSDETGLVGYWKMDDYVNGNTTDSSGQGNNGSVIGGAFTNDGRWNKGYNFADTNSRVVLPHIPAVNFTLDSNFSVSFWFKSPAGYDWDSADAIVEKWTASTPYPFTFRTYNTTGQKRVSMNVYNGSTGSTVYTPTYPLLNDGNWHHVVGIKNGTTLVMYGDAIIGSTATLSVGSSKIDNPSPICIGIRCGLTAVTDFNGTVDEIRIYNRSLSASEVQELYLSKGLVGHWKMDALTRNSTDTYDSSGYPHHGKITGAVLTNEGRFKEGYKFNGSGSYINMGDVLPINSTNQLSGFAWIRVPTAGNTYRQAFGRDNTLRNYWFGIDTGDLLSFYYKNSTGGGDFSVKTTETIPEDGTWHLVGFTMNALNLSMYIDGTLKKSEVLAQIYNPSTSLTISHQGSYPFIGTIDEVRIYNRALTADEIMGLYQGKKTNEFAWWSVTG